VHPVDYAAPTSLPAALSLLAERRGDASVLAGGTDVIVQAREGRRHPGLFLDVKKIPELMEIAASGDGGLRIGAAVPCAHLSADDRVRRLYPALAEAAGLIGGTAIQSRATLGGNLCNASPAADSIPALIVLGAVCEIAGSKGRRELPVEEMCVAPGHNALGDDELLVALRLPPPASRSGAAFERFTPRNEMDIAVCNCAASVTLSEDRSTFVSCRIALGAVGPTPLLATEASAAIAGMPAAPATIEQIADAAATAARPITDMRGSAQQRLQLARVLAGRVLDRAAARARGEP
jgi:CO/xanthine dehydrogenase FAD-binding subunit